MISVHFQGKSLNITVIQIYTQTTGAKEVETDQFYMEKAMANYSSTLAWKIPWTEEPCRLQFMWWQGVRHN